MADFKSVTGKLKFKDIDVNKAAQYCGSDALYTAQLFKLLYNDISNDLINLDLNCANACINMEKRGLLIDVQALLNLRKFCETRKSRLEKLIYASAGKEFNINSSKQLGIVLYEDLGIIPDSKSGYTEKGAYATGAEAIEALVKSGCQEKILRYIGSYRNMVKLISTYINRIIDGIHPLTGRYHPYFKYTGTDTGRLSSDFQQLPASGLGQKIRSCVVPPKSHKVVAADYSQIEIRILAHLMDDENVNAMIKAGADIHTATASVIFKKLAEEVTSSERSIAKTLNFALVYGRGDDNIATDLGITLKEAKEFKEVYFKGFPKLRDLIDGVIKSTQTKGYSETISGRRRYLPDININPRSKKDHSKISAAKRQAFNAVIQGSAADLIRQVMPKCDSMCKAFKAEMVLQVHDELVFYVPDHLVDIFTAELRRVLEVDNICGVKINVPIVCDIGVGDNYYESK
jgi:DNA polymerase-1